MDKDVLCFLVEETDQVSRYLRRYAAGDPCPAMPGKYSYHTAKVRVEPKTHPADAYLPHEDPDKADPRWPKACACGYAFKDEDDWQVSPRRVYRRADTGATFDQEDLPPGAAWYAWWMADVESWCGPDGRALMVRLPDGSDWHVDGRANNCDSPCATCGRPYHQHRGEGCKTYEDARPHKCWVRHGTPPNVTVDKAGVTCGAGAGSIQTGRWHGFLTDGILSTSRNPQKRESKEQKRRRKAAQ